MSFSVLRFMSHLNSQRNFILFLFFYFVFFIALGILGLLYNIVCTLVISNAYWNDSYSCFVDGFDGVDTFAACILIIYVRREISGRGEKI